MTEEVLGSVISFFSLNGVFDVTKSFKELCEVSTYADDSRGKIRVEWRGFWYYDFLSHDNMAMIWESFLDEIRGV